MDCMYKFKTNNSSFNLNMHGNKFLWRFPEEEGLFSIKNLDLVQIEEEKNPTISFDVGKK